MKRRNGINPFLQNQSNSLGMLVMYRSKDGRDPWEPIHRDDVPEWIKDDPKVVGKMLRGHEVHNETEGGFWYRAVHAETGSKAESMIMIARTVH